MRTSQNLIDQINELTTKIETQYPEIYRFIDEQPITVSCKGHPESNEKPLRDYLDSLKQLLQHHLEHHNNKA